MASEAQLKEAIQAAAEPTGLSAAFSYFSEAVPQLDPEDYDIVVPLDFNSSDRDEVHAYFGKEDGTGEIGSVNMYRLKNENNIIYQGDITEKGFGEYKDSLESHANSLCAQASALGIYPVEINDFTGEMGDIRNEIRGYYRSIQSELVENERLYGEMMIDEEAYLAKAEKYSELYKGLDKVAQRIDAVRDIDAEELKGIREDVIKKIEDSDIDNKDKILEKSEPENDLKNNPSPGMNNN